MGKRSIAFFFIEGRSVISLPNVCVEPKSLLIRGFTVPCSQELPRMDATFKVT